MNNVALRLKNVRAELNLKQDEMAEQSGVSARAYQGYEAGRSIPGGEAIEGFVRMGINANWLLTGEGPMLIKDLGAFSNERFVGLDRKRLAQALDATDRGLKAAGREMMPDKKADLVVAVYDLMEESNASTELVLTVLKTAA
jgi:transcriptional regulator with XRE-family HTH domain